MGTLSAPDVAAVDTAVESLLALYAAARDEAQVRLSSPQLQAMLVIERDEGLNLRALAGSMDMILSSASRLCDRLAAAGLVERVASQIDRREVSLILTPSGQAALHDLREDRRARLESVLNRMAPAGRAALVRGLREFTRVSSRTNVMRLSA
jgi:DNA-binding MarR family transcriptional regulator